MKRILFFPAFLIGSSMLLCLASCGGSDSSKTESASETAEVISDTSALASDTTASATDTVTLAPQPEQATAAPEKPASKPADKPVEKAKAKPAAASSSIAEGKALIAKSDCFACHKTDTRLVGPAYAEVAEKYSDTEENFSKLADKIINGGAGVWGEIPMAPHPTISSSEAKKMAQYILSLK